MIPAELATPSPAFILAIDPGEHLGWAIGNEERGLVDCGLGDGWRSWVASLTRAVLEYPVIRPGTPNANDIVTLAFGAGKVAGHLEDCRVPVQLVRPVTWKGNLSKKAHHPRIVRALRPEELPTFQRGAVRHDVVDAVGLLLWAMERRT